MNQLMDWTILKTGNGEKQDLVSCLQIKFYSFFNIFVKVLIDNDDRESRNDGGDPSTDSEVEQNDFGTGDGPVSTIFITNQS